MAESAAKKTVKTVPNVRRRVYVLGFISLVMAALQASGHFAMLSLVIQPEHFDSYVAGINSGMIVLSFSYLGLSGRLLFLFHEKRYNETSGPEWLWWFCSFGLVTFNLLLLVWYALVPDIVPAVVCVVCSCCYIIFFKFAKDDLKFLRDTTDAAITTPIITTTASAIADLPLTSMT